MELYESKNTQVEPQQLSKDFAIHSPLFKRGFKDEETPLDQYNLNLLIRGIKENNVLIEESTDEIEKVKDSYLTFDKLKQILSVYVGGEDPLIVNKPVKFKYAMSDGPIDLSTSTGYRGFATVEYLHKVLNSLTIIVDGGTADTAINESWRGPSL